MARIALAVCCILAAAAFAGARPTRAAEVFVDNLRGDDRNDGSSAASVAAARGPVRTIRRALELAGQGDQVVVANTGVAYREYLSLSAFNHCGQPGRPFVIRGQGATLDGSAAVPPGLWRTVGPRLFAVRPPRRAVQRLFRDGKPLEQVDPPAGADRPGPLEDWQWTLVAGAMFLKVPEGVHPADEPLAWAELPVGITLYGVHDVVILDLTVQGYQLDGINAHDRVVECRLGGVTARGNGRAGITVAGTSRVRLDGCLLGDNGQAQLLSREFAQTRVETSVILDNTAPGVVREGGQVDVIEPPAEAEPAAEATEAAAAGGAAP